MASSDRHNVRLRERAVGHPLHDRRVEAERGVAALGLHRAARAGRGVPHHQDDDVQVDSPTDIKGNVSPGMQKFKITGELAASKAGGPPRRAARWGGPARQRCARSWSPSSARSRWRRGAVLARGGRRRRRDARAARERPRCAAPSGRRAREPATRARSRRWSPGARTRGRPCGRSPTRLARGRVPALRAATASCTRSAGCTQPGGRRRSPRSWTTCRRSNDPGCSAGFAHGLVTGVGPTDPGERREAVNVLRERRDALPALQLRARARPRLHADLRRPARGRRSRLCDALGPGRRPTARRAPTTTTGSPSQAPTRRRCRSGPSPTHASCAVGSREVRAAVLVPRVRRQPPAGVRSTRRSDLEVICEGLGGLQRSGCITAVSVIGPPDPAAQLQDLRRAARLRRRRELRPRRQGAEPLGSATNALRPADPCL